jgi:hypothetical protein
MRIENLDDYMHQFAGYGSTVANLWFVGLEEGGGRTIEELTTRVGAWAERGRRPLEDLADYHRAIHQATYFEPPFPLQRTWAALCKVRQGWLSQPADSATLKTVQARELGRLDGQSTLAELMPLPATSLQHWPYASLASEHPALRDRDAYRQAYTAPRESLLRELIRSGNARLVVFYGRRPDSWSAIAGKPLRETTVADRKCYEAVSRDIYFIAVPHPVAHGLTTAFWVSVGAHLRAIAPPDLD